MARNRLNDFFTQVKNPISKDMVLDVKKEFELTHEEIFTLKRLVTSSMNTEGIIIKEKLSSALNYENTKFQEGFLTFVYNLMKDSEGNFLYQKFLHFFNIFISLPTLMKSDKNNSDNLQSASLRA